MPASTLLIAPPLAHIPGFARDADNASRSNLESPRSADVEHGESAPTIKITIGRVDVRATVPERPAPRPAAERPAALSLEEYLKERSGGKR
jgi:hypothetical protein